MPLPRRLLRPSTGRPGLGLALCLSLLTACSPAPKHKVASASPVMVATVDRGALPDRVQAVGTVEAINAIAVKSRVDGQLLTSLIHDGDQVSAGQLLFRIDPRPAQAALAQAQAALSRDLAARALAQAQVDRYRPIAAQHFISADQMQQYAAALAAASASVRVDQANVDAARLTLAYTDIHAPIGGRAGRILVQPGNLVKANDTSALLTINQIAPIYVSFAIPGDEVARVRAAQAKGVLDVRASGDKLGAPLSGRLAFIDNAVDPATNTVKLRASFANTDQRLWPGQFVNITLDVGSDVVLSVPDAAVKTGPDGSYVFVLAANKAHQQKVNIGRSVDGRTLIAAGLQAGQTVVTDGQSRLVDGGPVIVVTTPASSGQADASP